MAKYHINYKGEPAICRAIIRCPIGGPDDHFPTPEAAQRAYERAHESFESVAQKKAQLSVATPKEEIVRYRPTVEINSLGGLDPLDPSVPLSKIATSSQSRLTSYGGVRSQYAPANVCGAITDSGAGETWCAQQPGHSGPHKLA